MDELLTPEEVAEFLKMNLKTVQAWLRTGKLKGSKLSHKMWRVKKSDLEAFLNERLNKE